MDEWLAQLEMDMDQNAIIRGEGGFGDEIEDLDDFSYGGGPPLPLPLHTCTVSAGAESNAGSNHASPTDYTAFLAPMPHFHSLSPDDINAINNNNWDHDIMSNSNPLMQSGARFVATTPQPDPDPEVVNNVVQQQQWQSSSDSDSVVGVATPDDHDQDHDHQNKMTKTKTSKKGSSSSSSNSNSNSSNKRKREPKQVQYHIMAERKRRELLSTQFISLSSILPDLKKTDKTSVLGEAIKYMKQLQEKVKALEEAAAKNTVESVVVVKKSQLVLAADDNNDNNKDNSAYSSSSAYSHVTSDHNGESLPEIEVKVCDKSMLIKLCCRNHNGILPKIFQELQDLKLIVVNSSVIPFGTFALDITVLVQLGREWNANVKDIIRSLQSAAK